MTRRRFAHCKNEKCNRRLGELPKRLEESDPPAPEPERFCDACMHMMIVGDGTGSTLGYAAGRRAGLWWGIAAGGTLAIVAWIVDRCAAWIVAR